MSTVYVLRLCRYASESMDDIESQFIGNLSNYIRLKTDEITDEILVKAFEHYHKKAIGTDELAMIYRVGKAVGVWK